MNFTTQDLLEFCAYFTLNKAATRLPLNNLKQTNQENQSPQPKPAKAGRPKMEVVQSKKAERVIKPKFEQVGRKNQKKSVSPIQKIQFKEPKQTNNKKYDLDYFMSQMSDTSFGQNYNPAPHRARQNENGSFYNKKYQSPSRNYDTFGKSGITEFQTFDQKVRRENTKYNPSAVNNFNEPRQNYLGKFSMTQQVKNFNNDNNSWVYGNQTQTMKKNYINQSKIPFVVPYNQYNQPSETKLNYSPSARNYSPGLSSSALSGSWIKNSPNNINESNLSKSRSKHQRKKSERPFYDASKLTLKVQNEPLKESKQDQSLLSQSFVSIKENGQVSISNNKQLIEQSKRQTSTTAPPRMYSKLPARNQRNQIDLDDNLFQTLSELQRQPPIALQVKIKSAQS